jgi:hypothetical protein
MASISTLSPSPNSTHNQPRKPQDRSIYRPVIVKTLIDFFQTLHSCLRHQDSADGDREK